MRLNKFINPESIIHSIKTAIACEIGFLITKLLNFPSDLWVLVTIIAVMCAQLSVGSVIQKGYLRFVSTTLGCLIAVFVIQFVGISTLSLTITIACIGLLFGYIATRQESAAYTFQGALSAVIILLNDQPTLWLASQRFIEITLGIIIATFVSQFILPIHARTHLRRAQANTLSTLQTYYRIGMMEEKEPDQSHYDEMDESIVKSLTKQRSLAQDSTREKLGLSFDLTQFVQCLYAEKAILRATTFMRTALHTAHADDIHTLQTMPSFITFNKAILETFDPLIQTMKANDSPLTKADGALPDLQILQQDLNTISFHTVDIEGLLFSASILLKNLQVLRRMYL